MTGTLSQLGDSQNLVYLTNVTFNGQPFSIMIDTGRYAPVGHESPKQMFLMHQGSHSLRFLRE
jgi:hypothetical protein